MMMMMMMRPFDDRKHAFNSSSISRQRRPANAIAIATTGQSSPECVISLVVLDQQSRRPRASSLFTRRPLWLLLLMFSLLLIMTSVEAIAPTIDYSHNMRILKLPKSTQVGELIYRLRGSDGDSDGHLQFGVMGIEGRALLDVVPVSRAQWNEADVYLRAPLTESQYNVTIYVTDGNKTTQVQSTILAIDDDHHHHLELDQQHHPQESTISIASEQQQQTTNSVNGSTSVLVSGADSTGNSSGRWTTPSRPGGYVGTSPSSSSPFIRPKHVYNVPEDTKPGESIATLSVLESEKSDLPVRFELRGQGAEKFHIKYVFGPRGQSRGELLLVQPLDYEKQNLYSLKVLALNAWTDLRYDTRNVASLDIVVTVGDVQDSAPVFKRPLAHSTIRLTNLMQPGDLVTKVEAEDGDFADQRPINYALDAASPLANHFEIDKQNGEIRLKRPPSELVSLLTDSGHVLTVYAQEVPDTSSYDHLWPPMYTRLELPIQLVDLTNEAPRFVGGWQTDDMGGGRLGGGGQRTLHAYLQVASIAQELKQRDTAHLHHQLVDHYPIQWYVNQTMAHNNHLLQLQLLQPHQQENELPSQLLAKNSGRPIAVDLGQGPNGTFELFLEGPDAHLFELEPKYPVMRQSPLNLFVLAREALKSPQDGRDEGAGLIVNKPKLLQVFIVARDFGSPERMSARIRVSIELLEDGLDDDVAPQFEQDVYVFSIYENGQLGQVVGSVKASRPGLQTEIKQPATTGQKQARIRYTSLTGLDSQLFRLDPDNGLITLEGQLDREKQAHYLLLAEARDQLAGGRSNYTKIIVNILDVNDNAPIFAQQHYDAVLLPDGSFHQPLVVTALDIDEPGSINSQVSYEIIAGNQNEQFVIDSLSGVIYANPNKQQTSATLPSILSEPIVPFTLAPPPQQAGKIGGRVPSPGPSSSYTSPGYTSTTTASSHEMEEETSRPMGGRPTATQPAQSIPMRLKNWLGLSTSPSQSSSATTRTTEETTTSTAPGATNTSSSRSGRLLMAEPSPEDQREHSGESADLLVQMESSSSSAGSTGGRYTQATPQQQQQQPRNLLPQSPFNPMKLPPVTSLIVRAHDFGIPLRSSTCKVNIYNQAVQSRTVSVILNGTAEQLDQRRDSIERAFGAVTGSRATIESLDALSESSSLCVARIRLAMPQSSIVDLTDLSSLINAIDYKPPAHLLDHIVHPQQHQQQQHQHQQQPFRHPTGTTITHYIAAGDRLYPATGGIGGELAHSASSNLSGPTTLNGGLLHPTLYTDINSIALDSANALERRLLIYIIIVGVCILALLVVWMIYSCSREDQVKLIDSSKVSLEDGRYQANDTEPKKAVASSKVKKHEHSKEDLNKTYAKQTADGQSQTSSAIANNLAKKQVYKGHLVESNETSPPSQQQPLNLSRPEQYSMYNGQVWFGPVPALGMPTSGVVGPGGPSTAAMTTSRLYRRHPLGLAERRASSAPSGNGSLDSALHGAIGGVGDGRNSANRFGPRPANGQFFPNTLGYVENLAAINANNKNNKDIGQSGTRDSDASQSSNLLSRRQRRRKVAPLNDTGQSDTTQNKPKDGGGHTNGAFEMDESANQSATSGDERARQAKGKRTSKGQASRTTINTTSSSKTGKMTTSSRVGSASSSTSSTTTCSSETQTIVDHEGSVFLDSDQELLGFDSTGTPIIATHTRRASLTTEQPQQQLVLNGKPTTLSGGLPSRVPPKTEVDSSSCNVPDKKADDDDDRQQVAEGKNISAIQQENISEKRTGTATNTSKGESEQQVVAEGKQHQQQQQQAKLEEASNNEPNVEGNENSLGQRQQQAAGNLMGELNERLLRRQKTLQRQSADDGQVSMPEEPSGANEKEKAAGDGQSGKQQPDSVDHHRAPLNKTMGQTTTTRTMSHGSTLSGQSSEQIKLGQVVGVDDMKNRELLEKQSIFAMTYSGIATDTLPS